MFQPKGKKQNHFFPDIDERKHTKKKLQMGIKFPTMVTGHGTLRSYCYRFKIKDDPECVCRMGPQTTHHLIWECVQLQEQRETLKNRIKKAGRNWPLSNSDLANNYTKWFQTFVNSINFDTLQHAQNRQKQACIRTRCVFRSKQFVVYIQKHITQVKYKQSLACSIAFCNGTCCEIKLIKKMHTYIHTPTKPHVHSSNLLLHVTH